MLILIPTHIEAEMLFGRTVGRQLAVGRLTSVDFGGLEVCVSLTGFGLPASGVGAAKAAAQYTAGQSQPHVILAGTGGTYVESSAPVGSVAFATRLRCLDVGVPATEGPNEWTLDLGNKIQRDGFKDWIDLPPVYSVCTPISGLFLSVATASRDINMAEERLRRNPEALVEEMEGYSTAIACHCWKTELTVCRGISNVVGNRDVASWRIEEAMLAVRDTLLQMLTQSGSTQ